MLSHLDARDEDAADSFQQQFPALKSAVIAAVNELSTEVDAYASISQRAPDYIHADETILTYGYSKIVELFCKHAGNKRRFQLIIAEGAVQGSRSSPNAPAALNGHDLAHILSKHSANIAVTVIPDSNIYAIMARVNKVLLAPQAIMADGGAIAPAGHCMVATAAKEFAVPVVCCSGPFSLTPLFAHNQSIALQQLQCPASTLPLPMMSMVDNRLRHAIHEDNVTVLYPAFDHITPDLVSIYVTNDGSQLPTYVFRQLSEYYHPHDYIL
jgi:translation initiation factor eIF-2B subunit beta